MADQYDLSANETALHICRRLYRFFVYYEIDEATELNVITRWRTCSGQAIMNKTCP
jgi:hypothetical protein